MKPITILYAVSICCNDGYYAKWNMGIPFYAAKRFILRNRKKHGSLTFKLTKVGVATYY